MHTGEAHMVVESFPVYDGVVFSHWEKMAETLINIVSQKAGVFNARLIETELALAHFEFAQMGEAQVESLVEGLGLMKIKQIPAGVWVRNTPTFDSAPLLVFGGDDCQLAAVRYAVKFDAGKQKFASLNLQPVEKLLNPGTAYGTGFQLSRQNSFFLYAEAKERLNWELSEGILKFDPVSWIEVSIAHRDYSPLSYEAANHIMWIASSQMGHVELLD